MIGRTLGTALLLSLLLASLANSASDAATLRLKGERVELDALIAAGQRESAATDDLWILHFDATLDTSAHRALRETGARLLGYLPEDCCLLHADASARAALAALDRTQGLLPYRPEWRLSPQLAERAAGGGVLRLVLSFVPDVDRGVIEAQLDALGLEAGTWSREQAGLRPRLWLRVSSQSVTDLTRLPGLLWAEEDAPLSDRNDDTAWVVQSGIPDKTSIWDRGLHGEGQILGHIDSGFRWNGWDASCWFADPEGDPVGPDHRKVVFLGSNPDGNPGHGFHTAGTLVGDGFTAAAGADTTLRALAYRARMSHSSYPSLSYDLYQDLVSHAAAGARVHSNSWGNDSSTEYTSLCQDIDRFSWENEDHLVLFAATNNENLKTPENAKNVLAVGANYADDFDSHSNGGRGPTADGRRKPEIYAPGYAVRSAQANNPCGYATSSGTSMACPAVSGAAALARQYFTEGWYPEGRPDPEAGFVPSGALLRATLINGAVDMTGVPGYPSDLEGWGRLILDRSLHFREESGALWLTDQRNAQGLETGEQRSYTIQVLSSDRPLEITLAFTDHPGELAAESPVVNDIDLLVSGPGGSYFGNVFDTVAGQSATGGEADPLNSVERVRLQAPLPGEYQLRVSGSAVAMGPQGFALIASGDLLGSDEPPPPTQYELRLDPGFPNPFPTAASPDGVTLSFELDAPQRVTLRIFSVTGRLVKSLVHDQSYGQGAQTEAWDGRDESGEMASNGIYFVRLETEAGQVLTARLVHLRR